MVQWCGGVKRAGFLPAPLEVHGDAFGVRQDVLLDGNGDVDEWVVSEQVTGDVYGERLDEAARAGGGEGFDFLRNGVIIDGAGNFIRQAVETLRRGHANGDEEGLGNGAFLIRYADEGADAQAADFDGVHG